jgi:phage shock protein A
VTTDQKLDSLTATAAAHDRLIEKILAASQNLLEVAEKHDGQIGALIDRTDALIKASEENARRWQDLERQWQAYLNTLPRQ